MSVFRFSLGLPLGAAALGFAWGFAPPPAAAQQQQQWFVPQQQPQRPPAQRPDQQPARPATQQPPAAVIGIVDIPEVQRVSTAFNA